MRKKIAIITGVTGGIGNKIAQLFFNQNYYIIGISSSPIKNMPKFINEYWEIDFSNSKSIVDLRQKINKLKYVSVLINNAGINIIKPQSKVTEEDFSKIENINLKIPYFLSKMCTLKMKRYGGKIVNIGSIWTIISKSNRTLYSTMKSGLHGLTRSMAIEHSANNILINTVSPGFVHTKLTSFSLNKSEISSLKKQIPLRRLAVAIEIAELVYFLSSDKNTYITGQNIIIDGGYTNI